MWRYRPFLPVEEDTVQPPLRVGWSPLYEEPRMAEKLGIRKFWLKDDGLNPTASLKDRASSMGVAKAIEAGYDTIACSSTGNAASSLAGGFWSLMAARAGVACAHAVFWSIVTPLAVLAAPRGHQRAALSLIVVASSVAMILGLPLGRTLGLLAGWRLTFLSIGAVAGISFVLLVTVFPSVPSRNAVSLRELPALLARPEIWGIYLITAVTITGHFTVYTFIEPFLAQIAHFAESSITWMLSIFGIVGIAASILYANFYGKCPRFFVVASLAGIALFPALLLPAAQSAAALCVACVLWGLAIGFFNLVFQASIIRFAPSGTAVVMSIYSGIYNVGIGGGALAGGLVCTHASLSVIGFWGGGIAAASVLFCLLWFLRTFQSAERSAAERTAAGSDTEL